LLAFVDDLSREVRNDGTKDYILVAKNVKSLLSVTPHGTIHRRCFYLRDDGDPAMQVGRWES
jgi:hypothetical protein